MLKRKNKKAQEEMMGFVLIVLLVIIIGVVFFAFSLRRPEPGILEHKSGEMSDMLHAMLKCQTDCEKNGLTQPLDNVIRICLNGDPCDDPNDKPCKIANLTFYNMTTKFLGTNTSIVERSIHGYKLSLSSGELGEVIFEGKIDPIETGTQTGSFFSVSEIIPNPTGVDPSPIEVKLRCYHVAAKTTESEE